MSPLPKSGLGGWSGRSLSGPYFTDTPDRACCQERCLISSLTAGPDPPNKEGHCVFSPSTGICSTEIRWGRTEGIWGMKTQHPVPQLPEEPQILEQKTPGPGGGGSLDLQNSTTSAPPNLEGFSSGLSRQMWVWLECIAEGEWL